MKFIIEIQYNIVSNIHELVYPEYGIKMSIRDAAAYICRTLVQEYDLKPLFEISESSCRDYYRYYIQFGSVPAEKLHTNKRNSLKWTDINSSILIRVVDNQPYLYLDEIADKLEQETGLIFSYQCIWDELQRLIIQEELCMKKQCNKLQETRKTLFMH